MKIDLHLHSLYSDGLKSPRELCVLAKKAKLSLLALTDHDTVAGLEDMRAAAMETNLPQPLDGVELSCGEGGRIHVLGYGPALRSGTLSDYLESARQKRLARVREMLRVLAAMGLPVEEAALPLDGARPVGRAHVARAMVAAGHVKTVKQAFDQYLGASKPANIPMQRLSAAEAAHMLRQLGAVPVLAHPLRVGLSLETLAQLLPELQAAGLLGMEVYHSSCNARAARQLDAMARTRGLLVTGGSDYHGDADKNVHVGQLPGSWARMAEDAEALLRAAGV